MAKLVTTETLAYFKAKLDAANEKKFMQLGDYTDTQTQLIRADKIQSSDSDSQVSDVATTDDIDSLF